MSVRHGIRLRLQRKEEGCECMWHDNPNYWASQVALVVKDLPANAGDIRDTSSIPESERSVGGGHGNPFQYSCLENPMGRGAWRATVHGVTESDVTKATWHTAHTRDIVSSLRYTINFISILNLLCGNMLNRLVH